MNVTVHCAARLTAFACCAIVVGLQAANSAAQNLVFAQSLIAQQPEVSIDPLRPVVKLGSTHEAGAMLIAQSSRDELFGSEPRREEKSKSRLTGFMESTVAYTYATPSHWSRAVGRLQVGAQGSLGDHLKWKVSGRADADLVYFASDFYLDRVKRDQRVDFFFKENYLDFSQGSWEFRLGAQQIVWGEVIGLFFADVVSARDMRDFLLPSFDIIRIPQWAARAEYFGDDSHIEFVWIPIPVFDRIGKPGADFYPAPLPSPTPREIAELFRDPQRPSRSLSHSNYGVRANRVVSGWDLSAFYYRSFSTQATHYRAQASAERPLLFEPRYDRIWQAGGTLSKDLGDVVLRAEAVYTHGQGFSVADLAAPQSVVKRPTFDYIAGLDWALPRDTRVGVQIFQRVLFGDSGDIAIKTGDLGASLFVSTKLANNVEAQLLWIQYFRDAGALVRPRLTWNAMQNLTASVGVDVFTGPTEGFFGRYNNRDRVYSELRYAF